MKIGERSIVFSKEVMTMSYDEFINYWETSHEKQTNVKAKEAAKKLKIKVPKKEEGGE